VEEDSSEGTAGRRIRILAFITEGKCLVNEFDDFRLQSRAGKAGPDVETWHGNEPFKIETDVAVVRQEAKIAPGLMKDRLSGAPGRVSPEAT
jgi:hypothetical protein